MSDEQEKQEEVVEEVVTQETEVVDEVPSEEPKKEEVVVEEPKKDDRPEKNYKAELARKNAEIEKLRAEKAAQSAQIKRDPNDISTWTDHELKTVINSNDPSVLAWKDQASDILVERRVERMFEKRAGEDKKLLTELKLKTEYPEATDPSSAFALRMEEVIAEYDLQKSPAGKLAAAKIVASEQNKGSSNVAATERTKEARRIADVKGKMVDGDRSKPAERSEPKKMEQIVKDLNDKNINTSAKALNELLKAKGMDRDSFFKR